VELNLVMYSGIAGLPENGVVKALRHALWQEHFGLSLAAGSTSKPCRLSRLP
jgi:hypothetical protein